MSNLDQFFETIKEALKLTLSPDKALIDNGQKQLSVLENKPGKSFESFSETFAFIY